MADLVDEAAESDVEIPDPPEPIENGVIDLGRLATDALFLARRSLSAQAGRGVRAAGGGRRSRGSSVCRAEGAEARRKAARSEEARKDAESRTKRGAEARLNWPRARIPVEADRASMQEYCLIALNCMALSHVGRFCPVAARYPKGSGQEVVSGRGHAIVPARPGRS